MSESTHLEVIGCGHLWRGAIQPGARLERPAPVPAGTPIGQHLVVLRVARVTESRTFYIVQTKGSKWQRRKCWSCGNRHSSLSAACCEFCATPLGDLEFLLSERWDSDRYKRSESWLKRRTSVLGMVSPVAMLYRNQRMFQVYHYNGESLLLDEPSPLPLSVVATIGLQLASTLGSLHHLGVGFAPFGAENVLVMPDGSVRWFDLSLSLLLSQGPEIFSHPSETIHKNTRNLCALLARHLSLNDDYAHSQLSALAENPLSSLRELTDLLRILNRSVAPKRAPMAFGYSDVGLLRAKNEDAWGWAKLSEDLQIYAVADGMGGHDAGEVASRLAIKTLIHQFSLNALKGRANPQKIKDALTHAFLNANDRICTLANAQNKQMGTTLVAAVVFEKRHVFIANAGDSRAYLVRNGQIQQITRDHTVVQDLLDAGKITPQQAINHPRAHVVVVTVGAELGELDSELHSFPAQSGDLLLLASDGLTGSLNDLAIARILQQHSDRRHTLQALFREAYYTGGSDNTTALIVQI